MRRMFASYRKTANEIFAASGMSQEDSEALIILVTSTLRGLRVAQMIEPDLSKAKAVRRMLADQIRAQLSPGNKT
jgi:hypothetical protein